MPKEPARPPQPQKKAQNEQDMKKWAIIGFGTIALLIAGYFVLSKLMEKRDSSSLYQPRFVPETQPKGPRVLVEDVPLAQRPKRLFWEFIKAVQRNQPKEVRNLSELDDSKMELLMTEEHVKILTESLQSKRWEMKKDPEKIEGQTAEMSALFMNGRGFGVVEIELAMRQRGGAEDWVVTEVRTRWESNSGHTPESRLVALGGDRTVAAAPIKDPSTFNKLPEGEPKTIDWLAGTSEAQKAEIERHMRDLFDTKNPARSGSASQGLTNIGKNAIPKLLSEFVSLDLKKEDDIIRGNIVDRTLAVMTDQEMGFDVAAHQGSGMIPPSEARLRAIRRWFGWWEKNKDHPLPTRTPGEVK
jgi:hypothetical protein